MPQLSCVDGYRFTKQGKEMGALRGILALDCADYHPAAAAGAHLKGQRYVLERVPNAFSWKRTTSWVIFKPNPGKAEVIGEGRTVYQAWRDAAARLDRKEAVA